jgi:triacylglycerol lipase
MKLALGTTDSTVLSNAVFLATAADIAYCPEAEGQKRFKEELGFPTSRLFSVGNTQAYLAQNDDFLILAFRGSERPTSLDGLQDWLLTNANNFLVLPEGDLGIDFAAAGVGARFHRGFITALGSIWPPVFADINKALQEKERPLFVCGHSLGGSLAQLASWRLQKNYVAVEQVYTFGGPMVGNDAAAAAFDKEFAGKIFRFVDDPDLVPRLPTVSLVINAYRHSQKEFLLGAAAAAAASGASFLSGLANTAGDAWNDGVKEAIWKQVNERLAAHDILNYQKLIGAKLKELA